MPSSPARDADGAAGYLPAMRRLSALSALALGLLISPAGQVWTAGVALAETPALPPEAVATWQHLEGVAQLRASFVQTQYRSVLSTPLKSTGTLAFARPNRIRWEVEGPVHSVFVLDGAKVGSSMPELGLRETLDLSASPEASRLVEGLMVWLGGDLSIVARDYDLVWKSGPPHVAELVPKNPMLRKVLAKIVLTVTGSPPQVTSVVLHEPSGDRVEIALSGYVLDAELPAGTFVLP